ncbi:activator-dependent family glycosyltransferase [Actinosynnema sp. NPDC047251]|uniref:Glycosyltransferase, family 1 n=1 Tax=Saccharothrix espanaensis (strain ATCC 51144 / DSM 44229 / JCM 9112 / NBRC 15066 / NRRL 15764) TaxID=1179773 RepID=K0K4B5_SACES|nr:activator-dependent family glycosyltransferase [Saccharothrix espanaensis]CCH33131.1 Glycosyltransferase, family 1 [Saccharothrix espanaensis DSM 44229]
MRVLFTANPGTSIFMSMAPLAWALRTAGHEVRFATQPFFSDTITQAGLTAAPVGRSSNFDRVLVSMGITDEMVEQARCGLSEPYDVVEDPDNATWERVFPPYEAEVERYKYETFPIIGGLVQLALSWKPDLVVWEPFTYAGPIAAKACGAAHVRLLWGVDVYAPTREIFLRLKDEQPPERRADPLAEWLGGYGRKHGFEFTEDMTSGDLTVDLLPASLQAETGLPRAPMRYVPYGGAATVPKWLWAAPERPRVALTLGTTATEHFGGYTIDIQDILDALADLDVEVVATVAEPEQSKLARVPDNARVLSYVPLHVLAPTCAAVINHAGGGTLTTFALHGVPQLTLPHHFDEPILARKLAEQGAGLVIGTAEASGRTIRDAVLRLLGEPRFRDGANRLRDELRAMPSPNDVVPQLEELAAAVRAGR